jgi:hypothetical protein
MRDDLQAKVNDALVRLGAHLGGTFALDAGGLIAFEFADELSCTIEVPREGSYFHLYAPVAAVPGAERERFLADMLTRNLFRLSVPGAWLALDDETVLLCLSIDGDGFDPEQLPGLLLAVTEEVRALRASLLDRNGAEDIRLPAGDIVFRG